MPQKNSGTERPHAPLLDLVHQTQPTAVRPTPRSSARHSRQRADGLTTGGGPPSPFPIAPANLDVTQHSRAPCVEQQPPCPGQQTTPHHADLTHTLVHTPQHPTQIKHTVKVEAQRTATVVTGRRRESARARLLPPTWRLRRTVLPEARNTENLSRPRPSLPHDLRADVADGNGGGTDESE